MDNITLLLAVEARDRASAILDSITSRIQSVEASIKAAAGQSTRSSAEIEAANTKAAASAASYERAVVSQAKAQETLQAAMTASKAAQEQADAAMAAGSTEAQAAAAKVTAAAEAEEAALIRLQEAERLVATRSGEMAAAQDATSTKTGMGAAALKGVTVAAGATALAVGIVGEKSVKAAADFQTGMVKLETTAGETHSKIGLVSSGVLRLAGDIGTTTENLSAGMYRVESAGFHAQNGLNVLRAAGEAARAEGAQMDTVTRALTASLSAYGDTTGKTAVPMTNEIVAAVGRGDMTMQDFASSLSAVLPIAAAAGLSFAQVGGAVATMTAQGMTADTATQNLAHTIGKFQTVTPAQSKAMQQFGIDVQDLTGKLGERGLTGTIDVVVKAITDHMGPSGQVIAKAMQQSKTAAQDANQMIASMPSGLQKLAKEFLAGSITIGDWRKAIKDLPADQGGMASQFASLVQQSDGFNQMLKSGQPAALNFASALKAVTGDSTTMNTVLKLSGDHAGVFASNADAIAKAGQHAGKDIAGWSDIQNTMNFRMDALKGKLEAAKISLGTGLLPAVTALVGWFGKLITPLTAWMTTHERLTAIILGSLGGISALILVVVGAVKAFELVKTAILGLRVAMLALNSAFLTNPIGLVLIALVALAAGIYYAWTHFTGFRKVVIECWDGIKAGALYLWHNVLQPAFEAWWGFAKTMAGVYLWLWHNIVEPVWQGISMAISVAWAAIKIVWALIQADINVLADVFTWLWHNVLEPVWQGIQLAVSIAWAAIQVIWGIIQIEIKILADVFTWLWRNIVEPVWRGISAVVEWAWNNSIKPIWDLIEIDIRILADVFTWLWRNAIEPAWQGIGSLISGVWDNVIKPVFNFFASIVKDYVVPGFKSGVDAIGKAWDAVRDIAKIPVKFVVQTVLNDGLLKAYNSVAHIFGVKPDNVQIPLPAGFAAGGYTGHGGKYEPAGIVHRGEYVIPSEIVARRGSGFFDALVGKSPTQFKFPGDGSAGLPGYADGGLVGALGSLWDTITNPAKALAGPINAIVDHIPGVGAVRDIAVGFAHKLVDGLVHFVTGGGGGAAGSAGSAMAFLKAQVGKPYIWASAGPAGYDCCIVAGVRIYGPDGAKPIEDVRAGDRVFSYVEGRLEAHTVTAAWQSIHQPVFEVRTRNRSITASANHPFLRVVRVGDEQVPRWEQAEWPGLPQRRLSRVGQECSVSTCSKAAHANGMCARHQERWRRHGDPRITLSRRGRFGVQWARLDELKRGDLLVQPRRMLTDAKPAPALGDGTPVDAEVAWLIGAMVGDGTVTDRGIRLCLYDARRERATRILGERWGLNPTHGESYGLVASCRRLADALAALGMRVRGSEKRVPEVVWSWSAELQQAFLDGYCDADGHRPADQKRHGERTYSSAFRELIEDVRALHLLLGDPVSNIHVTKRTKPVIIKGKAVRDAKDQHSVTVWPDNGHGEARFRNQPGLAAWLDAGDFTLGTVLAVEPKGEADTWDLNIEGSHNFVADGVVVHNSGIVSAVYNVLHGKSPYSHTFSTANEAGFFPKPGMGILTAGWTNPGEPGPGGNNVGHTAGVLAGIPFESTGGAGVHMGAGVTPITAFAHMGTFDRGGPLYPGLTLAYNGTGRTEHVTDPQAPAAGQAVTIDLRGSTFMSDRDIDALIDKLDKRLARTLIPSAGIQVRR